MSFWRAFLRFGPSKVEFQEQKEQEKQRKHEESGRRMLKLVARREALSTIEILSELEEMHRIYAIALWPDDGRVFVNLLRDIRSRRPKGEEAFRLITMLTWQEFRRFKDRSAAHEILYTAERNPNSDFLPVLWQHMNWLEGALLESQQRLLTCEIEGYSPTPHQADQIRFQEGIDDEIRLTRKLVAVCEK